MHNGNPFTMNKNKYLLTLITIVLVTFLTACSSEDSIPNTNTVSTSIPEYQVASVDTFTSQQIADRLYNRCLALRTNAGNYSSYVEQKALEVKNAYLCKVDSIRSTLKLQTGSNDIQIGCIEATIHYQSVDLFGNPVTLSAFLACPVYWLSEEYHPNLRYAILDCHYTMFSNNECPTITSPIASSFWGLQSVHIAPDYLGYGLTDASIHPYICHELNARNSIDALKAGYDLVTNKWGYNVSADFRTYFVGASQGAAVALAAQKLLEQNESLCNKYRFSKSYLCSGPYSMQTTMKVMLHQWKTNSYPAVLPLLIQSVLYNYPDIMANYKIEDFFTSKFIQSQAIQLSTSKKYTTLQINAAIFAFFNGNNGSQQIPVDSIFSKEVLDSTSNLHKAIYSCMQQNDFVNNWMPKHPIEYEYSIDDEVVPCKNSYFLTSYFKSIGFKSYKYKANIWFSHEIMCALFYLNMMTGSF